MLSLNKEKMRAHFFAGIWQKSNSYKHPQPPPRPCACGKGYRLCMVKVDKCQLYIHVSKNSPYQRVNSLKQLTTCLETQRNIRMDVLKWLMTLSALQPNQGLKKEQFIHKSHSVIVGTCRE